jgi:Fe-S oxidoreductase
MEDRMTLAYAPGCALMLYKPHLADKVLAHLSEGDHAISRHLTCCRHEPHLEPGSVVINTCAGCDRRYRELYEGVSTVSLWEVLADSDTFDFPDYHGAEMTVHDACPTRSEARVHDAVRTLLRRMNVTVIEPAATRTGAVCCGDSFFGQLPDDRVAGLMARRAASMPREDVVVYCVSCVKAMHIGGRRPRYLVDLLFGEETTPGVFEPTAWHTQLDEFIAEH